MGFCGAAKGIGLKIRIQSKSIHSIKLDVHVLKAEHQNSPFLSMQLKLDKDFMLSLQFPLKLYLFTTISVGRTRVVEAKFQIEASDPYPPRTNGGQT